MKNWLLLLTTGFLLSEQPAMAQKDNPVGYMQRISTDMDLIQHEMLGYVSAVAHGKSARKVAKQRSELMTAISGAKNRAAHMPEFEGDTMLRFKTLQHFTISYNVLKEDYGKVMDLEEIADQSYDNMEAYILVQRKANEKLSESFDNFDGEYRSFAAAHHVTINDVQTKEGMKMKLMSKVMDYYNDLYLPFFKVNNTEVHLIQSISKNDIAGIEQNRASLAKFIEESRSKTNAFQPLDGDNGLIEANNKTFAFYESELGSYVPATIEYLKKREKFEKLKSAMEKKDASQRTNTDVETYNTAVNDMNAAVDAMNKAANLTNTGRSKAIAEWDKSRHSFLDKHVPVAK